MRNEMSEDSTRCDGHIVARERLRKLSAARTSRRVSAWFVLMVVRYGHGTDRWPDWRWRVQPAGGFVCSWST